METPIIDRPSPNHGPRPAGVGVDMLVLHYTGMTSAEAALARLCDPAAEVSAHWLIDEDGTIVRLVPEERRAWHAGLSSWRGRSGVNDGSIGIELVNPGHEFGYRPFPQPQIDALTALCEGILDRWPIPPRNVVGHSDIAPARKTDPGELFPWAELAAAGIGVWPGAALPPLDLSIQRLQASLSRYGYDCPQSGTLDSGTQACVAAFQRHFRQTKVDGIPDAETAGILEVLTADLA